MNGRSFSGMAIKAIYRGICSQCLDSKMKNLCLLGMIAAALFGTFACYAASFWGWETAARMTAGYHRRAEYNMYAWLAIFIGSWIMVFALRVCWVRSCRSFSNEPGEKL